MGNYFSRGIKGVFSIVVLAFLSNLVGYFTRAILARKLEVASFGLFYSVYSLVMFLTIFSYFGLGEPLVKYIAEYKAKKQYDKVAFSLVFPTTIMVGLAVMFSAILYFSSGFLAEHFFKTGEALVVTQLFSFVLLGIVFLHILLMIFKGFQDFVSVGAINFLEKVLFTVFVVTAFFWLGLEPTTTNAAYALILAFAVAIIFFLPRMLKYRKFLKKPKYSSEIAQKMKTFAVASFLSSIALLIIGYIDTLMLTYFRTLEEVGIYNVILPTVMVLAIFTQSVRHVLAPMVSELWAKNMKKEMRDGINLLRRYSLISIVPLVLVLFTFPELIIQLLFGPAYVSGALAMQILTLGIIFFTIGFMDLVIVRFIGKPKEATMVILAGVGVNVVLNLGLIPLYGIIGAALTTTLSYVVILLLGSRLLHKFVNVRTHPKFWIKIGIASMFFVMVTAWLKNILVLNQYLEAIICLAIAGLVYLGICYYFAIVSTKDFRFFVTKLVRK